MSNEMSESSDGSGFRIKCGNLLVLYGFRFVALKMGADQCGWVFKVVTKNIANRER